MLGTLKTMLGLIGDEQDTRLTTIIDLTESRLRVLLGGVQSVPEALRYITVEVAIRRFNRVGSEGLASHSVEGETMTWPDDDFTPYARDIQDYLAVQADPGTYKGRVRFI